MRIACVGAGPAGLYVAIAAKLRDPRHEVTVYEKNPQGRTFGWGVTYSDDLLDLMHTVDPVVAAPLADAPGRWRDQEVHVGARRAHLGGYGYAIGRAELLNLLTARGVDLGVDVRHGHPADDNLDADLVVAADGAHSRLRTAHAAEFGTELTDGATTFAWLATPGVFSAFRYAFERTAAGPIWFYSYPYAADRTTFIVECSPQTRTALGLDTMTADEALTALGRIFARHLQGAPLLSPSSDRLPWETFTRVTNLTWHHHNVVLVGDAAHTTHFSIGSGTTLAIGDAVELAQQLATHSRLDDALATYSRRRRAAIAQAQAAACRSARWFEDLPADLDGSIVRFAYALAARRGGYPAWRYQLHLATQVAPLRAARSALTGARVRARASRRTQVAL